MQKLTLDNSWALPEVLQRTHVNKEELATSTSLLVFYKTLNRSNQTVLLKNNAPKIISGRKVLVNLVKLTGNWERCFWINIHLENLNQFYRDGKLTLYNTQTIYSQKTL